jgi:hypothetical protein
MAERWGTRLGWPKSFLKTARTAKTSALNLTTRSKRHCYWRFELPKFLLEIVTIGLIAYYAGQAWRQANEAHQAAVAANKTAQAAEKSNSIAHENAVKDLRAYVSVGGPSDHKMAEISIDPKTGVSISVYFFNGGRTPAHHFMATIWAHVRHAHDHARTKTIADLKKEGQHIQRFEYLDNGERSSSGGLNIAANSSNIESAQSDKSNLTPEVVTNIQNVGGQVIQPIQGPTQWPSSITVFGTFEYCDEFGGYHCNELDLIYDASTKKFVPGSQFMDFDCNLGPITEAPYRTRNVSVQILSRCEQPGEQEQAQREADQSEGKIFTPEPTPIPQSTPTAKP